MTKVQNDVTTQEVKFYFEETFIGDQKWEIIADFLNEKYEWETKEVMRKDIRKQCKDVFVFTQARKESDND